MKIVISIILLACLLSTAESNPTNDKIKTISDVGYSDGNVVTSFFLEGMSFSVIVSIEKKTLLGVNCTYTDGDMPLYMKERLVDFYKNIPNKYSIELVDGNIEIVMLRYEDNKPFNTILAVFQLSEDGRRFIIKN